jgi:hypothetical protein
MKVKLTEKRILEIEGSIAELRNGKHKTKFALMVRKATRQLIEELKDWYATIEEKRKEYGELDEKTNRYMVKPGSENAAKFEAETRDALTIVHTFAIEAIPLSEFEKYVPDTSAQLLDDLIGIVINDGTDPVDMTPPEEEATSEPAKKKKAS